MEEKGADYKEFRELDLNLDNFLDISELREADALDPVGSGEFYKLVRKLDSTEDGKVSFKEYLDYIIAEDDDDDSWMDWYREELS